MPVLTNRGVSWRIAIRFQPTQQLQNFKRTMSCIDDSSVACSFRQPSKAQSGMKEMPVTTSTFDGTLLIAIDRPPVNALDLHAIRALEQTFAGITREVPQGGIVLTGSRQFFSAGVDTRAFASYSRDQRHEMVRAITQTTARLLAIPVPVVAAVNGHALGGGFVLMLACDYRIAADAEATKLGMTEAQAGLPLPAGPLGIIPHGPTP